MIETALLSFPVRALITLFNTVERKDVSLKSLLPMGIAAIVLFPFLSFYYGATGAGIAAFFSTMVWLAAYLFYYKSLLKNEKNLYS